MVTDIKVFVLYSCIELVTLIYINIGNILLTGMLFKGLRTLRMTYKIKLPRRYLLYYDN